MDIYEKLISEIQDMVGEGKRFEDGAALARACNLPHATISRYLAKERGKGMEPFLKLLEAAGMISTNLPVMRGVGTNAPEMLVEGDTVMAPVVGAVGAQVHHLKYAKNIGREPIDWLVSVCHGCHQQLHHK